MVRMLRNLQRDRRGGVKIERERMRYDPICSKDTTRSSRLINLTIARHSEWHECKKKKNHFAINNVPSSQVLSIHIYRVTNTLLDINEQRLLPCCPRQLNQNLHLTTLLHHRPENRIRPLQQKMWMVIFLYLPLIQHKNFIEIDDGS
jgi:hypothetical protein